MSRYGRITGRFAPAAVAAAAGSPARASGEAAARRGPYRTTVREGTPGSGSQSDVHHTTACGGSEKQHLRGGATRVRRLAPMHNLTIAVRREPGCAVMHVCNAVRDKALRDR